MSRPRLSPLVLAGLLVSCGGGSDRPTAPTAPSTPPPVTSFTVVAGDTGQPLAGARAVVGGRDYVADGQGRVTFEPGDRLALVDILAPGYFDRQTRLDRRESSGRFTVWPRDHASGLDAGFTSEVVYTDSSIGGTPVPGAESMRRWPSTVTQVRVVVQGPADNPEYGTLDEESMAVLTRAAAEINQANGGAVVYLPPTTTPAPAGAGIVHVRLHPAASSCPGYAAFATSPNASGANAAVTFCEARYARSLGVTVHELGHTFGLRHSSTPSDVMKSGARTTSVPSARERLVMQLMLQRPRGNRFPDNDRDATSFAAVGSETVSCR